jgi:hypothetical protein
MSRSVSRGMLQVKGVTYRVERTQPHCYSVVRLLDDLEVGTFQTLPTVRINAACIDLTLLRDVVRAALRSARTSAVMHVAPAFEPDRDSDTGSDGSLAAAASPGMVGASRSPSSAPPRAGAHAH